MMDLIFFRIITKLQDRQYSTSICILFQDTSLVYIITAYDLLNRTANFSTSMLADYISYNWTQRSGRYLMLNLSYKFDKTGKLKKRD